MTDRLPYAHIPPLEGMIRAMAAILAVEEWWNLSVSAATGIAMKAVPSSAPAQVRSTFRQLVRDRGLEPIEGENAR